MKFAFLPKWFYNAMFFSATEHDLPLIGGGSPNLTDTEVATQMLGLAAGERNPSPPAKDNADQDLFDYSGEFDVSAEEEDEMIDGFVRAARGMFVV